MQELGLNKKRYIIRKYVFANSIQQAIKKEMMQNPDDIWLDDDWKKINDEVIRKQVGF